MAISVREAIRKKNTFFMEIFRKGGGGADPIHNFGTHFLCTKSYGILCEKGGGRGVP